jgi:myo-inositol catabolism protein IolC
MTANLGFDKPLYILSFDHRDLLRNVPGSEAMLTEEHTAEIEAARSQIALAKHTAYSGFQAALASGVPSDRAGILVDEQFGNDILRSAAAKGYIFACPAEKSRQDEFEFEYGEDFAKHIETFHPTFCKVQVWYNAEGDQELNRRQSARLKRLSDYLRRESRSLFMLEILLSPDQAQLNGQKSGKEAYDADTHPRLTLEAIAQLQHAQVEPDVWGFEGFDRREDYEKVVVAARHDGRDKVSCIILGESNNQERVREWLTIAAGVPGFIGFALGRTILTGPLSRWAARETTPKGAAAEVGRRFREFINLFEKREALLEKKVGNPQ